MRRLTAGPFWFTDLTQALSDGLDPAHLDSVRRLLIGPSNPEKWRRDHDLGPPLRGWRSIRVDRHDSFILIYQRTSSKVQLETVGLHDATYLRIAIRADVTRHPAFRRWLARLNVPEQK